MGQIKCVHFETVRRAMGQIKCVHFETVRRAMGQTECVCEGVAAA